MAPNWYGLPSCSSAEAMAVAITVFGELIDVGTPTVPAQPAAELTAEMFAETTRSLPTA